jgi:cyclophilin family peptidyl-prolyl cis-trans isomerase
VNTSKRWFVAVVVWIFTVVCSSADEAKQGQRVEIRTELGSIVVELDPASSPRTCEAFLSYIQQHVYQGSNFHQKDEEDIQGGGPGPETKGFSSSGNFFENAPPGEFKLKHVRGAIGLARTVGDCNPTKSSNSTQFYIMWKDEPKDDGEFSVFGHVVKGMEVVDRIADVLGKDKDMPVKFDVIAL